MIKKIKWDGKPITKQGFYTGIPLASYHKQLCDAPSVSSSGLRKCFAESPAHFYAEWSGNPNRIEKDEEKKHYILGRAVHHLMLGEPYFAKTFCIQPDEYPDEKTGVLKKWTYAAGYCKDWRTARQAEGRSILTSDQVRKIRGMARELSRHPLIKAGALNGEIESSTFWKDKSSGLWVKMRPDAIPTTSVDFVDLKTTTSVQWKDLQRTIAELGYHQQGALVREGARIVLGIKQATFSLVFVESDEPHCVRVVTLKDSDLDRGEKANHAALDTIARCIKSKHWPGPGGEREDAEHIELPEWAQQQIDDRLEFGI